MLPATACPSPSCHRDELFRCGSVRRRLSSASGPRFVKVAL